MITPFVHCLFDASQLLVVLQTSVDSVFNVRPDYEWRLKKRLQRGYRFTTSEQLGIS